MAIINAANNGNWSSAATWPGSVFPTSADDVFANNRTIYIDQNINVLSLNTTAGAGGVAGGRFFVNQGDWTINAANIIQAGTTYCVTVTGTGTRTLSSQTIRGSDTNNPLAAVLIQGTATALPNVVTYGNIMGGSRLGSTAGDTPAGVILEGGMLTHYGFISGGTATRSCGLKIYQAASSTIPVSAIVYGDVKGGPPIVAAGIVCEFSPAANTLSACLISIYGNLSGGDSLLTNTTTNAGLYTTTSIPTFVFGNIHAGSGFVVNGSNGIIMAGSNQNVNIVGDVYSHPIAGQAAGILANASGTLSITGNVIALDGLAFTTSTTVGQGSGGIYYDGLTTLNIYGNVRGPIGTKNASGYGLHTRGTNTVTNIYGDVYGGNTGNAVGILISTRTGNILNVYGNVYGFSGDIGVGGRGIQNNIASTLVNVFGSVIAGEGIGNDGILYNAVAGTIYAKRVVGSPYGIGSGRVAYNPVYALSNTSISGINLVEEMVFGSRGQIPVFGPTYIVNTTTNSITGRKLSLTTSIGDQPIDVLIDSTAVNTFVPATSNVRTGTTYGNNLTGTMIIPLVSSVSFDIPVDNSRGTAFITPSAFWSTQTTQLTSLSTTIGFRLNNAATTEYVGNTLAAYNI